MKAEFMKKSEEKEDRLEQGTPSTSQFSTAARERDSDKEAEESPIEVKEFTNTKQRKRKRKRVVPN